ncbi:MAG: Gfo/Idh/MocA family oxidoreductase [Verrucomicrobiae bacterium]|nr:Gfo/Idh/MocA family oxidoreductase [Verrucomicrobiae bacterium]
MSQRKWRVAVSGIGWCGCAHIKAFQKHPRCEVVRLHGRDEARVRRNLEQYAVSGCRTEIVTRVEDLFREGIDILSIAGLNSTHTPLALEAARRGIHLMIEKPVARDAEELDRLVQGVRAAGVKTVVSFELYWNPLLKVAR